MQKSKLSIGALAAAIVLIALTFSSPMAFADGSSGKFNPQTQFPVGTTITFSSLNGVALQRVSFTKPRFAQYDAAASITVEVDQLTKDGGIHWKVTGGTFTINGQTYTITEGEGHMNSLDMIASGMDGQATGPDGTAYQWRLNGLAVLYNGVVLVGLRGGIGTIESNGAFVGYRLGYMVSMT
jgi:hypothetical protein